MYQKYVNAIGPRLGMIFIALGLSRIYQSISSTIPWPIFFGGVGFILLGLYGLLQKKLNLTASIIILISAISCLAIYIIGLLS